MAGHSHENNLHISWYDSLLIPVLNPSNVMDYFSERSNPFYDRQCNNEVIKMQRLNPEQLNIMVGPEYILLHTQEPILYVVRHQHRHSPTQVTPLADYYIIAGVVYQAPNLGVVVNSRLLNAVHSLDSAFEEAQSFSRYHPSKGYSWEFKDGAKLDKLLGKDKKKKKEEPGSQFQRHRVNLLLQELELKYPPKSLPAIAPPEKPEEMIKVEPKVEVKMEKTADRPTSLGPQQQGGSKPPPEKKPKLIR